VNRTNFGPFSAFFRKEGLPEVPRRTDRQLDPRWQPLVVGSLNAICLKEGGAQEGQSISPPPWRLEPLISRQSLRKARALRGVDFFETGEGRLLVAARVSRR
jgi:hypothetical protein